MKALCHKCPAMCCRYIALPFDTPETRQAFDEARWFLMHEGVNIFVSGGQWYVSMATACRHLTEEGLCGTYATRPKICRAYADDNCDYHGGDYNYSLFFTHPQQMQEYADKVLGKAKSPKAAAKAKRKPAKPAGAKGARGSKTSPATKAKRK